MHQSTDIAKTLLEVRRLLAEREAKKIEMDAIDRAIRLAVGLSEEDRPKNDMPADVFRAICRSPQYERVSKKKRSTLDSGLV